MKLATFKLDPKIAFIFQSIGLIVVTCVVYFTIVNIGSNFKNDVLFIIFSVFAGVTGGLGTFFLLKAYEKGNLATVTVLTALYPVIAVALGILILKEKLTITQIFAIILSLVAIVLFSL